MSPTALLPNEVSPVIRSHNDFVRPVPQRRGRGLHAFAGACACGLFALLVYLLLQNRINVGDGVDYAYSVKLGNNLFHPHHVLYNFFCHRIYSALYGLSSFSPLYFMGVLSSIAMAITVALFYAIAAALTERALLSALFALAYAFTYATFYLGTTAEVYPFSMLFSLFALFVCVRTELRSEPALLIAALLCAGAMLFHQAAIFFTLSVAYFVARQSGWRRAARFTVYSGVSCAIPYVLASHTMGVRTPAEFIRWILFYVHTSQYKSGEWGHGLSLDRLALIPWGFFSTVVALPHERLRSIRPLALSLLDFGTAAAVLLLVFSSGFLAVRLFRTPRNGSFAGLRQLLWLWLGLDVLFTAWWNQTNPKFWYMMLPALYLLCALRFTRSAEKPGPLMKALGLSTLGLFFTNVCGQVYADSRSNNSAVSGIVNALGCQNLSSGDTLIGPVNNLKMFVLYSCDKLVNVTSLGEVPALAMSDKPAALQHYADELYNHHSRVYLLQPELHEGVMDTLRTSAWDIAEIRAFYQPYLLHATLAGRFTWYNQTWDIYRLPNP
jgi:hypothetical protein